MSISSISPNIPTILTSVQKTQAQQAINAATDNDGDSDDHGGPPDADGVRGSQFDKRV